MSGGHWQYAGPRIEYELEQIGFDPSVLGRWPRLARLLVGDTRSVWDDSPLVEEERGLCVLYEIENEMDRDLSGDSKIKDDDAFDRAAVWKLLRAAMIAAPDEWFPRGKWATIQAVEARAEGTS